MEEYEIRCTQEQTRKALELGVPIEYIDANTIFGKPKPKHSFYVEVPYKYYRYYLLPTAQQMIGFLRSKGFRFKIDELSDTIVAYRVTFGCWFENGQSSNPKGATLAVIDAALEYLSKFNGKSIYGKYNDILSEWKQKEFEKLVKTLH